MKELEYRPIEPQIEKFNADKDLVGVAKLYAEVFASPPWNEYTKCLGCKEFFGLQTKPGGCCANCGKELGLAYPIKETKRSILDETARNKSIALVMKQNEDIIGFAWGFSYLSADDFVKEKYRNPQMQSEISRLLETNGVIERFFYFSECGVRVDQRGKGFSSLLSELLLKEVNKTGLPIVMRTNWESPMVAVAQRFGMKQIMGQMIEIDRNKRTIVPKEGAVNGFKDSEIEKRVLFVLQ